MGGHVNLSHIIDDHDADSTALIAHGRTTTYGQLHDQVARFRGGLASLGVGDGDRVALVGRNGSGKTSLVKLLTRLYDWLNQVEGALVKPKDPTEYRRKLNFHRQAQGPRAYGLD